MSHEAAHLPAHYDVIDDAGVVHLCRLHCWKVREIPQRGTFLELWFTPVLWMPSPPIYGPYIIGELDQKRVMDGRVTPKNEWAEVWLDQLLARAMGMRYQETPLLRLGGDAGLKKVYRRG